MDEHLIEKIILAFVDHGHNDIRLLDLTWLSFVEMLADEIIALHADTGEAIQISGNIF